MIGKKKLVIGMGLLIFAGAVLATGYSGNCNSCGNSNEDRSYYTAMFLRNYDVLMGAGNTIKPGDTITVNGGDGTRGVYKKYSQYDSIRFGCVSNCGAGDGSNYFRPPVVFEPEDYDFHAL